MRTAYFTETFWPKIDGVVTRLSRTLEQLAAAYASADLFALPLDTETLGFVAMDARTSGALVVGARAGGSP